MVHSSTRRLLTALTLAGLIGVNALAADATGGKAPAPEAPNPVMVLGATRAQTESDISDLAQAADANVSGWRVAWTKTEYLLNKTSIALQEAMTVEEHKGGDKDQAFYDGCHEQKRSNDSAWQDYLLDRTVLDTRYGATWITFNSVRGAYDNLAQFERVAKEFKLDLAPLIALYAALDDKAKAAKQQAQVALADLLSRQTAAEARLKKSNAIAKREKPEPEPAPAPAPVAAPAAAPAPAPVAPPKKTK